MYQTGEFFGNVFKRAGDAILVVIFVFFLIKLGGRSDSIQEVISHINLEIEGVSILIECTEEELLQVNASGLYRFYDNVLRIYSRPDIYMRYISSPELVGVAQYNFERTIAALPFCGRLYPLVHNIRDRLNADMFTATCIRLDDYYSCQEAPKTSDDYSSMLQLSSAVAIMRIGLGDTYMQNPAVLPQSKDEIRALFPQYSGVNGTDILTDDWSLTIPIIQVPPTAMPILAPTLIPTATTD